MDPSPTSLVFDLDNQTQEFDDFDDIAPSQLPSSDTPTSSTSMAKVSKKWAKRGKADEKIIWDVKFELGRIANALETDKSQLLVKNYLMR